MEELSYYGKNEKDLTKKIENDLGLNYEVVEKSKKRKWLFGRKWLIYKVVELETPLEKSLDQQNEEKRKSLIELIKSSDDETSNSNEKWIEAKEYINQSSNIKKDVEEMSLQKHRELNVIEAGEFDSISETTECEKIIAALKYHDLSDDVIDLLLKDNGEKDIQSTVEKNAILMMNTCEIFREDKNNQVIALVGPTGVGKTTTIAKLSSILKNSGASVGLVTADTYRLGAVEQLEQYGEYLGTDKVEVARNEKELPHSIQYFTNVRKADVVLVDTSGRNPLDKNMVETTKACVTASGADTVCLVLSATQKKNDMIKTINNYLDFGLNSIIFTKVDETDSVGFMFEICSKFEVPVSYIANGQEVPSDISKANGEALAKRLMSEVLSVESSFEPVAQS